MLIVCAVNQEFSPESGLQVMEVTSITLVHEISGRPAALCHSLQMIMPEYGGALRALIQPLAVSGIDSLKHALVPTVSSVHHQCLLHGRLASARRACRAIG